LAIKNGMEIERKWKGNGMENLWKKFVDAK
jgi:hypothetical protein